MLRGTLAADLVAQLPAELREAYDLDSLVVADFDGVIRWATEQALELLPGSLVTDLFADSVLTTWHQVWRVWDPEPI